MTLQEKGRNRVRENKYEGESLAACVYPTEEPCQPIERACLSTHKTKCEAVPRVAGKM